MLELERQNEELIRVNAALETQMQTRGEKESLLKEKTLRAETMTSQLNAQLEKLRAETVRLKAENLELPPLHRYRRRVEKWVRGQIERLKNELNKSHQAGLAHEARISDLRAKVSERDEELTALQRDFVRDQAKLVEQYEAAQKVLGSDIQKLLAEQKLLRGKAALVDQAARNEALAQNRLISLERNEQEMINQADQARKELKAAQNMIKSDQAEMTRLKTEIARLNEKLSDKTTHPEEDKLNQSSLSSST